MRNIGIYIHIPFCKSKCYYCDFVSFCNEEKNIKIYTECLKKEIEFKSLQLQKFCKKNNEQFQIDTIFIGGGTPSIIESKLIVELLENIKSHFKLKKNLEVTIEVNPDSVTFEKLMEYKKNGINRISIGLQSSKNKLLKEIGRPHNFEQFKNAFACIKKAGFSNINVDLMIALPDQSISDVKDSLKEIILLKPSHISVYSLILEEGTKLFYDIKNGNKKLVSENLERKMYWYVKQKLEENGFIHYEISNFSKPGKESKHNLNCWNQNEYLGIGLSAHSFFNNVRFSNITNLNEYIKNIQNEEYLKNEIVQETLNLEEKQKEYMILGLRKLEGVQIKKFKEAFNENPIYIYRNQINKLITNNLIEIDEDYIKLTNKGLDFANIVWEEFV